MAEQNQDLPLVVSEIIIELHGIQDRLGNVETELQGVQSRLGNVENLLLQVVDNVQHMSGAITRLAEVVSSQQEATNENFRLLKEADERNTTQLAAVFQQAMNVVGRRFDNLETRLEQVENK